jgi:hypothetical protein
MAYFYGRLKGARGEVTRCGAKSSGINSVLSTWSAKIKTELVLREGVDVVSVYMYVSGRPWVLIYEEELR